MQVRRAFPWTALLALWLGIELVMVLVFRQTLATGEYGDADDFMRLVQVRDLIGGQSWFDLTQHRINPPAGLPMHWSRLVDLPIVAVMLPLVPVLGQSWAETVALVAAPALTLLVLMIAVTQAMRRLFGPGREMTLFASILLLSAPLILVQIHPARIDHHGWQIATAAVAFAALLDRKARRSGLVAGIALGCYVAISIEGLPYVVAAVGSVALLWAFGKDSVERLTTLALSLAATALVCFMFASPGDWSSAYCDQLAPAHIASLAIAALSIWGGGRVLGYAALPGRLALLASAATVTALLFAGMAPTCLAHPYGQMDPVVHRIWFMNVSEGLPIWRQSPTAAVGMVAFPLGGLIGASLAWRRANAREAFRRWSIVVLLSIATLLTGLMVRRAAGVSHVVAIPGAFAIIYWLRAKTAGNGRTALRALAQAGALIACSPLMPVYAAAVALDRKPSDDAPKPETAAKCGWRCAMQLLARMPRMTLLTGIDVSPTLLAMTRHSAYSAGYHRLQAPMRRTMDIFMASPGADERAVRATGVRYLLIAPQSDERFVFDKEAPNGLMARLARNETPAWLAPVDLGSPELKLYRVR